MKIAGIFVIVQSLAIFLLFPSLKTDAKPFADPASLSGTIFHEIHQDSLKDMYFKDVFGPIPLNNTPTNAATIPLAGNYSAATPVVPPPVPLNIKYVCKVTLDTAQTLNVTVANNSSADFSSVSVTLGTLGSGTITTLIHNTSGVVQINAGGKEIDSVVTVSVTCTPAGSGSFAAGNNLGVSFSLNGLKATRAVVMDSLLKNYSRTFTNEYDLTDTLDVDYIDIATGFFIYSVTNYTGCNLQLSVAHRHLWGSAFCLGKQPPLTIINDLAGLSHSDSVFGSNCDIAVREQFPANQTNAFGKHNISANRLFAEWNPAKKKSVTKVDYTVNVGAYGRRVTLSAEDSLQFAIKTASFKYKEMSGTVMEAFKRSGDTVKSAVPSSWYSASNLKSFFMAVTIPVSAFIDSFLVVHNFFNPKAPDSNCTITSNMSHVVNNSFVRNQVDFSKIIVQKPDSVYFTESIVIPVGSRMRLINDLTNPIDPDFFKYIGRMRIHDSVSVSIPLSGVVTGRTTPGRFECSGSSGAFRYTLPVQCRVSVQYYDTKGRLLYSFVNNNQGLGRHFLPIPAFSFAHGAYFRVFEAGKFVKKETVLILR